MAFMTPGEIEKSFNISGLFGVEASNLEYAHRLAKNDVYGRVSPDNFNFVEADLSVSATAADKIKYDRLRDGHALLTISKLLLTQTQIRRDGVVKHERGENAQTVNQFLTPKELKELRDQYEAEAKERLAPYILITSGGSSMGTLTIGGGYGYSN